MSLAKDFISYLKSKTAVTDIVGAKIVHGDAEQIVTPYIVFTRQTGVEDASLSGADRYDETTYLVRCVGGSPEEADELARVAHRALNSYRGTWNQRTIQGVIVLDKSNDSQRFPAGSDETRNQVELTVQIFSIEPE